MSIIENLIKLGQASTQGKWEADEEGILRCTDEAGVVEQLAEFSNPKDAALVGFAYNILPSLIRVAIDMNQLVTYVRDLETAAFDVLENWEKGDLAGAVRNLHAILIENNEEEPAPPAEEAADA